MATQTPSESQSNKNNDKIVLVGAKKDRGKLIVRGGPTKRLKQHGSTFSILSSETAGISLLPVPLCWLVGCSQV